MDKEFIGKNVEVTSLFGIGFREAGAIPIIYRGKLIDCDDNQYKISLISKEINIVGILGGGMLSQDSGIIILNKSYVSSIKLLD